MEKTKSAVEAAREFGVDIEQLCYYRQLTPLQRLQHLQAMAELVYAGRAALKRQRENGQRKRPAS